LGVNGERASPSGQQRQKNHGKTMHEDPLLLRFVETSGLKFRVYTCYPARCKHYFDALF
jgi:hypothetical protein